MRILISGAGIGGPTLAYWLRRAGHSVTIVEKAPRLRSGGYIIDFWGTGYDIAEKMGVLDEIRGLGYQVKEVRFVDDKGRTSGGFSTGVFDRMTDGRFTSVRRSDVSRVLFGALDDQVEAVFGDSITKLVQHDGLVTAEFEHAAAADFDLVVGADGLHSNVREKIFGATDRFEHFLGFHAAAFELPGYGERDDLVYLSHAAPGRQISRFSMRDDKTLFLFVFRDEYLQAEPESEEEKRQALRIAFSDVGWECPQILDSLEEVENIYFDRVSQIRMDRWSRGRIALVGDAGACVSLLAGEGTGLAMTEAYILAGALSERGDDPDAAFDRYEEILRPFLEGKQASAAKFASSFAPKTSFGIWFRNLVTKLLRVPFFADHFIGRDIKDDLELPEFDM